MDIYLWTHRRRTFWTACPQTSEGLWRRLYRREKYREQEKKNQYGAAKLKKSDQTSDCSVAVNHFLWNWMNDPQVFWLSGWWSALLDSKSTVHLCKVSRIQSVTEVWNGSKYLQLRERTTRKKTQEQNHLLHLYLKHPAVTAKVWLNMLLPVQLWASTQEKAWRRSSLLN